VASQRINESILGTLERPALAWMARRLPAGVTPNHLTAIGYLGSWIAAAGYVASSGSLQYLWLACLGLLLHWAGDSLDGTVARLRNIERPRFGFFVDHTSDLFSQTIVFLSVGISPCAHFAVACLGLIAFLSAFVHTLIHAHVRDTMRITYFGFGATEIRALLLAGNLLTLAFGVVDVGGWVGLPAPLRPFSMFDAVICLLSLVGSLAIGILVIKEGLLLARLDPPRRVQPERRKEDRRKDPQ
jgi:archaetidylinositol phosphate synthase